MFIVTIFLITKNWKQPRCTSDEEWISKLQLVHPIISKKTDLAIHATTGMNLKCDVLSERRLT